MSTTPFLSDRRGYSMAMWAMFVGLCLVPLFVLAVEISRFANVVSDVQQAADAAALAAVTEIDPEYWRQLGQGRYTTGASLVYQKAQEYLDRNASTASVRLSVGGASITPREDLGKGTDLVKVEVNGDLKRIWLFGGNTHVSRVGIAALRLANR